uniref:Uncharacterized protein n=1 Tax=Anguilla anguilla TaxID=7936 RepID=A0A0E9VD11_ANGAN
MNNEPSHVTCLSKIVVLTHSHVHSAIIYSYTYSCCCLSLLFVVDIVECKYSVSYCEPESNSLHVKKACLANKPDSDSDSL